MKIKFIKEYRVIPSSSQLIGLIFAVGTVLDVDNSKLNDDDAQWLIDNGFAEEVKESGWWKPKNGERYYYIRDLGRIDYSCYAAGAGGDEFRVLTGNSFKTREAAERYRDYLQADATVRQDEGVLTPDQLQEKERDDRTIVYIGFDSMGYLATNPISLFSYDVVPNAIFFDNEMHAQSSLDNHRKEWETIANYDWSRE